MNYIHKEIHGWGKYPKTKCKLYRPENELDLDILLRNQASLIARGCGMSYGDAAMNTDCTVDMRRFDKVVSFDPNNGVLVAESGLTIADIITLFIPRGWFPPVIPGTKHVSLGGAVAANVHGKNQYKKGDFSEHVNYLVIQLPDGSKLKCSSKENADLFFASFGGMGLTGFIIEISLNLVQITSDKLKAKRCLVSNIEAMIDKFEHYKLDSQIEYMVGWIDHFAENASLGKGVFECAYHDYNTHMLPQSALEKNSKLSVPDIMPSWVLNKYSMVVYNKWRFWGIAESEQEYQTGFDEFFHPLDSINNWNNLYGRNGLLQYQFLLPDPKAGRDISSDLRKLLNILQQSGNFSYLAVIKYHNKFSGILNFSNSGYSIALDFPNNKKIRKFLSEFTEEIIKLEGRIYLAKDAVLNSSQVESLYRNELPIWRNILKNIDVNKLDSLLNNRLGLVK